MTNPGAMLNPIRDASLLNLGLDTSGIVHLDTCRAAGMNEAKTRWLVDSGRWQVVYPRTFATFSGPLPYRARLHAALIYAGEGAALSHTTAGAEYTICPRPDAVHLTVPYRRQVDAQPGIIMHRSRRLTDSDVDWGELPKTKIERTVIDLVGQQRSAHNALGLVGDALRTRRTSADRLRAAFEAASRTRWRKVVLDALPDMKAGAQSLLELKDAQLRRRHGLPSGVRQVRRMAGGVEYLDVVIEEFGVHIELDGRLGHDRTLERWRDMRRDNRSEVAQLRNLRYGWADLADRPCEVAAEQAEVLRQQGWPGPFRRCPHCPSA